MADLPVGVTDECLIDASGEFVYVLCDQSSEGKMLPLYVGQSRVILGRLAHHISNDWRSVRSRARRRNMSIKYVHLLKCEDAARKIQLEKDLIDELDPIFNSQFRTERYVEREARKGIISNPVPAKVKE